METFKYLYEFIQSCAELIIYFIGFVSLLVLLVYSL